MEKKKCVCKKYIGEKDLDKLPINLFDFTLVNIPVDWRISDIPERIVGYKLKCKKCGKEYEICDHILVDKHMPQGLITI